MRYESKRALELLRIGSNRPTAQFRAGQEEAIRHIVDGALAINPQMLRLPKGVVLLVDDMVDSRWTLTVAAWLLQAKGSGPVFPLALAITS